jgi:hypothetical protein
VSIVVFTGKPGSGKTYRIVQKLLAESKRYYVFHNIAGLKEVMIEDGQFIQDWTSIKDFLTKKGQEKVCKWAMETYGRSVLVIVDEAQMYFADRSGELKSWLSWHRHLGEDIWLVAQHYKMLNQDYYNLADYECRAKRGIATSQFVYQYSVGGEVYKTDRVKSEKGVFAAYRSFEGREVAKGRSRLMQYGVGLIVLAVVSGIYLVGWGVPGSFAKGDRGQKQKGEKREVNSKRVWKNDPPSVQSGVAKLIELSYAGCMGSRVLMQSKDGGLTDLADHGDYHLVECNGKYARVMAKDVGMMVLRHKNIVKVAAQGALPSAGMSGGNWQKETP